MKRFFAICIVIAVTNIAMADIQTFGFDDGTYQGWEFVDTEFVDLKGGAEDSAMLWKISLEEVDLGENNWNLLQGSTVNGIGSDENPQREPNYRVIPDPWSDRDCIGVDCLVMLFRSPVFKLDDSGPISVDIIGGQGKGGSNVSDADELPESPFDLGIMKGEGIELQGYGLYDVADETYVEFGFPTINNDGKEKDGRGGWETVEISTEDLAPFANDGKDYRLDIFDSLSGGWGWIGFDTVKIPNANFTSSIEGDCDESGSLDAGDLSCVSTIAERDAVLGALNTLPGDLDGMGGVAFADFLTLSGNFGNAEGSYADGNIDLMGGIEFADFLALSGNFGKSPAAAAAAVPEPDARATALLAVCAVCWLGRRKTVR